MCVVRGSLGGRAAFVCVLISICTDEAPSMDAFAAKTLSLMSDAGALERASQCVERIPTRAPLPSYHPVMTHNPVPIPG